MVHLNQQSVQKTCKEQVAQVAAHLEGECGAGDIHLGVAVGNSHSGVQVLGQESRVQDVP